MPFLARVDKFNGRVSSMLQWVGVVAILFMMTITTIDVFMAKVFLSPIRGALDVMELAQLIAISFAGAATLLAGKHVQVEFVVMILPKRVQDVIAVIVQILCLVLFVLAVWRLFRHGYYLQTGGEVSATARIPVYPFAYGAAVALIPLCFIYIRELIESCRRVFTKWTP